MLALLPFRSLLTCPLLFISRSVLEKGTPTASVVVPHTSAHSPLTHALRGAHAPACASSSGGGSPAHAHGRTPLPRSPPRDAWPAGRARGVAGATPDASRGPSTAGTGRNLPKASASVHPQHRSRLEKENKIARHRPAPLLKSREVSPDARHRGRYGTGTPHNRSPPVYKAVQCQGAGTASRPGPATHAPSTRHAARNASPMCTPRQIQDGARRIRPSATSMSRPPSRGASMACARRHCIPSPTSGLPKT